VSNLGSFPSLGRRGNVNDDENESSVAQKQLLLEGDGTPFPRLQKNATMVK
jgi:hypothetical protein